MDVLRADNSVKKQTKADVHNNNAHTRFGENPLIFTKVIVQK